MFEQGKINDLLFSQFVLLWPFLLNAAGEYFIRIEETNGHLKCSLNERSSARLTRVSRTDEFAMIGHRREWIAEQILRNYSERFSDKQRERQRERETICESRLPPERIYIDPSVRATII